MGAAEEAKKATEAKKVEKEKKAIAAEKKAIAAEKTAEEAEAKQQLRLKLRRMLGRSTSQIQQQQQQQQKTISKRAAEEITATPEKGARSEKKVPEEGPSATEDGRTEGRKKGWRVVWERGQVTSSSATEDSQEMASTSVQGNQVAQVKWTPSLWS